MADGFLPDTWEYDLLDAINAFANNSTRTPLETWRRLLKEVEPVGEFSTERYAELEKVANEALGILKAITPPLVGESWPTLLIMRLGLLAQQQSCLNPDKPDTVAL